MPKIKSSLHQNAVDQILPELWCFDQSEPKMQTDLMFICSNGSVHAHKMVLKVICKTLDICLANHDQNQDEMVTVILPEVNVSTVSKFLELVYTGSTRMANDKLLDDVKDFGSNVIGFALEAETSVSIEDSIKEYGSDIFDGSESVEDCSVEPQISAYFEDEDDESNIAAANDMWYQQIYTPKREKQTESINCPECQAVFPSACKVFFHAINVHYHDVLKNKLQPYYKAGRGICTICQKPTATLQSYLYHMGVKHRIVFEVMPKLIKPYYTALLSENPDRLEDFEGTSSFGSNGSQLKLTPDEMFFHIVKNIRVSSKVERTLKCPECQLLFQNPEMVYAHAVSFHYFESMVQIVEPDYTKSRGMCNPCNAMFDSFSSYVHHMSFDHKLLHQFIPHQFMTEYCKMTPVRMMNNVIPNRRNPRSTSTVKGSIPCPECEKTFDSISALYFHASAIHYKRPLNEMYGAEFKLTKGHCPMCGSKLNSKQYYYIHMGSRHKVIHTLMDPDMLKRYTVLVKTPDNHGPVVKLESASF